MTNTSWCLMLLNVSRGVLAYSDFCSAVFSFGYIIIIFKYRSVRGPDLDIRWGEEGGRGQSPKFGLNIGGRGGAPPLDPPLPSGFA